FMPIGHAPTNDRGPRDFGGARFLKRQGISDWPDRRWYASWGIQIYTGIPSERNGARWHDFYFPYQAVCAAPDAVLTCVEALLKTTANPLLTLTKSGGLRFSCRVPDYLHPSTGAAKAYIYKYAPTVEDPHRRDVYLEIRGEKGYSRWDSRYEILCGDLLNPPVITKEVIFTPIDALRAALHEPGLLGEAHLEALLEATTVVPASIGSKNLNLAKDALLQRGFSYLRENAGFHHWIQHYSEHDDTYVSLWEDQGIVWLRASTPNTGLPTRATAITDIWNDTGITPPTSASALPISDKVLAVRAGQLSPLGIKRPPPVLYQQANSKKAYQTLEAHATQMQQIYEKKTRIIGITAETVPSITSAVEAYLLSGGTTCLNIAADPSFAEAVEARYHALKLPSSARWRGKMYRWEQAKDIPTDERMANPFQAGNLCEDPERCRAIEAKGGKARECICPKCPVHTECQARGYLSQLRTLKHVKAQISPIDKQFFDPQFTEMLEHILDPVNETERVCILEKRHVEISLLFLESVLLKDVLEKWAVNWYRRTLGNFATSLLRALETHGEPNGSAVGRVRSVVEAFQQYEEEIVQQMCHINVPGKVVTQKTVDDETGKELSHFAIAFEGGTSACIPLDTHAEDRLTEKGVPCFSLDAFIPNADIEIPMRMAEAITLGVLDTETVEKIQAFPTVYHDPNWTLWHQLKRFFAHYPRDVDAPMRWSDKVLQFYVPPILHPSVKRLLLMAPTLSERHLCRVFPGEAIEVVHTEPTAWVPGNQVFQIRTDIYSLRTLLNYDTDWDALSLSKIGERLFLGIRAEIDRDPSVKHAIIANTSITEQLADLEEKENVCFVAKFKKSDRVDLDFQAADIVWIVGTPRWNESELWFQAQILFGNDTEPLHYVGEPDSRYYKDERIQNLLQQNIVGLLTRLIGQIGLNRWTDKKVMLLTSCALPNITDRPETRLFDWEDFEIAGGFDKLPEVIATREGFEAESAKLTAESSREEVERVLGCSSRQANRLLYKLRGGNISRVSFQEQILTLLADGEKKASELVEAIGSSPQSVGNELRRLVDIGKITRVKRGVYALKTE
ncbi:MAG: helix-turn-helix domain-containing protein, partial [Candidatus Poribacteria bacterium]|nr:helix-turn-helix domain-containing protein [Candidatus Poribacteria bacterium]